MDVLDELEAKGKVRREYETMAPFNGRVHTARKI
jgi:hypothetical protein